MHEQAPPVRVCSSHFAGLITLHPHAGRERGILLLNASETEARIRFLPGFVSASFLTTTGGQVCEYVQWETQEHLAAALRMPELNEHMPVAADMVESHRSNVFGHATAIHCADQESSFGIGDALMALAVFEAVPENLAKLEEEASQWCKRLVAEGAIGAAVHVDKRSSRIGVVAAGEVLQSFESESLAAGPRIECMAPLRLYRSVVPPQRGASPLHYRMLSLAPATP